MNLIQTIAEHIAQGLSASASALKLEAEHGLTVSEQWVRNIMSADGFAKALEDARASVGRLEGAVETELGVLTDAPAGRSPDAAMDGSAEAAAEEAASEVEASDAASENEADAPPANPVPPAPSATE